MIARTAEEGGTERIDASIKMGHGDVSLRGVGGA